MVGPQLKFKPFAATPNKGFIVGPGDHFPRTAILSCPCHYHHLLLKTFIPSPTTSTPVFQPLRHGIHLIRTRLRDTWPPHLLQRYRWGLHWDRRLPSAYILPKHSRDWSKARPIVSYTQTACAPQSDGCFCHLLPFADCLPGADRPFGRPTSPSPYLEDTSTL